MNVIRARDTLVFTSAAGGVYPLLERGDFLSAPLSLLPEAAADERQLVGRDYIYHRASQGVAWRLSFGVYALFATRSDAERELALYMQEIMLHRDGSLEQQSAFLGDTPTLIQTWQATLNNIVPTPLTQVDDPEVDGCSGRSQFLLTYSFTLTHPS